MQKKGQAAMEFLMTYGWAILAAIVVIAVLAIYFRPSTLVSGSTFVTAPFYAVSQAVNTTAVQLEIKNNGGEQYTISAFAVTVKTPNGGSCPTTTGLSTVLTAGGQTVLLVNGCTGLVSGGTFNADIGITYTKQGANLAQKSTGTIAGTVSAA